MKIPLTNTKLSIESGVVAGVLTDAVERGDGVGGGDGVVGTNVDDVEPETIHIVRLNHNFTLKHDLG